MIRCYDAYDGNILVHNQKSLEGYIEDVVMVIIMIRMIIDITIIIVMNDHRCHDHDDHDPHQESLEDCPHIKLHSGSVLPLPLCNGHGSKVMKFFVASAIFTL